MKMQAREEKLVNRSGMTSVNDFRINSIRERLLFYAKQINENKLFLLGSVFQLDLALQDQKKKRKQSWKERMKKQRKNI